MPVADIFETELEITLLADMPGVKPEDLDIDLRENTLTLAGEVEPPEGAEETDIFREYQTGRYFRQFTLSEVIDQSKIDAKLNDGVLRLTLPKVEKAAPRKIMVKAG
ncbi:Hsp20/alpha crystallin family protein [Desulfonema magnum]|uniref:Hsp20/alpha crystallin family protein n=1 Tax=Desulfonema magnum TaxID=45655 RepID=UPI00307CEA85